MFSRPSKARVYDDLTGGRDNVLGDREVASALEKTSSQIRVAARANLEFASRASRFVAEQGVEQFLNLGCGLPPSKGEATYTTVSRCLDDPRVLYVDSDPHVAVHARALLDVDDRTGFVDADVRDVDAVLSDKKAQRLLDPGRPVCIIATAVMHFIAPSDDPRGILSRYMEHFTAGGYLVFSYARDDLLSAQERAQMLADYTAGDVYPLPLDTIREQFLAGLELVEPGLVEASTWRPDDPIELDVGRAHFVAAVATFPARGDDTEAAR
ncbi:SAM-dependent methyltransferase [Nonomuraea maheshkhaliensis]